MKKVITLSIIASLFLNTAVAQTPPKLFETARLRSASVQLAQSDLTQAIKKLERTKNDPLALKIDFLNAQIDLSIAQANFTATNLELRRNLTHDYNSWQESLQALSVQKLKTQQAQSNLAAAQIRFKAGTINKIDLARAEVEYRSGLVDLDNAQTDLVTAISNLRVRVPEIPNPQILALNMPKPDRKNVEANLENNKSIIQARGLVERNQADVDGKDNEFTAPIEINAAKTALENAQRTLEDTRITLRNVLSASWDAYQTALSGVSVRESNLQNAQDELNAQTQRFQKGLITKLALLSSQIQIQSAQFALLQAQNRVVISILDLAIAVNLDLWTK